MKKTMLIAVLAAVAGFTASAEVWKIDGDFQKLNAKKMPARWVLNAHTFKQAKASVVPGKTAGKNAVKIVNKGGGAAIYSGDIIPSKTGDKVEVEFEAKGKGRAYMGAYFYGNTTANVGICTNSIMVNSPAKFTKYKVTLTFKEDPKRPIRNARAVFGVIGAGDITFASIKFDTKK